jgi:hypothetical protein
MLSITEPRLIESRPIAHLEFKDQACITSNILTSELKHEELHLYAEKQNNTCVITLTDLAQRIYQTTFDIKDGSFLLYLKPPTGRLGTFTIKVVECKPSIPVAPTFLPFN